MVCWIAFLSTFFLVGESCSATIEVRFKRQISLIAQEKANVKDGPSTSTVWKTRRTKLEAPTETMRILPPPAQEPERHIALKLG
jgi:hypothetical protein